MAIYDDASDDDSVDYYREHGTASMTLVEGKTPRFGLEQYNKDILLRTVLASDEKIDWFVWMDGDTILDRHLTNGGLRSMLEGFGDSVDAVEFHNINLWRDPGWRRLDSSYDGLWPRCCWRNNGMLRFEPRAGLHGNQYPAGLGKLLRIERHLIHYGFASTEWVIRKHALYRDHGQTGWDLDRLLHEKDMNLIRVPDEIYPEEEVPARSDRPEPMELSR